ncbi:hypothetical protein J6590_073571 [Homalodisca vitripennis]|nr:hypothetical protein J6590_073571 [Homalodisca vitripennis]
MIVYIVKLSVLFLPTSSGGHYIHGYGLDPLSDSGVYFDEELTRVRNQTSRSRVEEELIISRLSVSTLLHINGTH